MSLILKIIILIISGLAILTAVLWLVFFNQQPSQAPQTNINQPINANQPSLPQLPVNTNANAGTEITAPATTYSDSERTRATLTRLAASFTERFGSYSNQSDYANFEDLYDFMTADMKRWAENMVAELRAEAKGSSGIYFGVTTKALSTELSNFDENADQAEVLIKTQRREASGHTANARVYYQDMILQFAKEKGVWKVDGAFWQE